MKPNGRQFRKLYGSDERRVFADVAVGHAWRVEREAGMAVAIEENQSAGAVTVLCKLVNGMPRGHHRVKILTAGFW